MYQKEWTELVVNSVCCKRAYIRGAFLASGSISDPEKMYHLEFACSDVEYSESLKDLINSFELDGKDRKAQRTLHSIFKRRRTDCRPVEYKVRIKRFLTLKIYVFLKTCAIMLTERLTVKLLI